MGITLKDFEDILYKISDCQPERRKLIIGAIVLIECSDKEFKLLWNETEYECVATISQFEQINERAKKLGLT